MKCENIQFNLSLYIDDVLTGEERQAVETHLAQCPLCRQKRDDYAALRQSLRRAVAPPAMPKELLLSVKKAVRTELQAPAPAKRKTFLSEQLLEFLQMRVMPYSVGTVASLLFGLTLLWLLLSPAMNPHLQNANVAGIEKTPQTPVMITNSRISGDDYEITPEAVVGERLLVSSESPSVNPQGALVALAKSLTGGKIKGDEVVVVADVFSDGLANIEEVVEPLDNRQTVYEIEKAFRQDSTDAPFVPAFLDRRADSVRVVLKIQRVDVQTSQPKAKRR